MVIKLSLEMALLGEPALKELAGCNNVVGVPVSKYRSGLSIGLFFSGKFERSVLFQGSGERRLTGAPGESF